MEGLGTYGGTPGKIIGKILGSAMGSLTEDLIFNSEQSAKDIGQNAAQSAAVGLMSALSSEYWEYAIKIANEAGSAAKMLMKYDEKSGEALKYFFEGIASALSAG